MDDIAILKCVVKNKGDRTVSRPIIYDIINMDVWRMCVSAYDVVVTISQLFLYPLRSLLFQFKCLTLLPPLTKKLLYYPITNTIVQDDKESLIIIN